MADEKEEKATIQDELIDFQLQPVIGEYKNKKVIFNKLDTPDSLMFIDTIGDGSPRDIIIEKKDILKSFIAKSIGVDIKSLDKVSDAFLVWCIPKIWEAIDADFFILGSAELMEKYTNLGKRLGLSENSLPQLPKEPAGQ